MPPAQPIAIERIVDRLTPEAPRVSPDGRHVAITVAFASKQDDRAWKQLWLARDGGEAAPFTAGKAGASDADWAPDSTRLVFTSSRDDKDDRAGLFVIRIDGGEAQQIGEVRGEISMPRWSPDGSLIAFLMKDPETEAEKKDKEEKRDHIVVEEEPKQQRLWVIDPETGRHRCLTHANRSVRDYTWAPGSSELVVVTTGLPTPNSLFQGGRLASVPASGGITRELASFAFAPSCPVVRELNGERVVAVIANAHTEDPAASIWTVPWAGGAPRKALPDMRGAVEELIADPAEPDSLLARIVEGTHARLYRVSLADQRRELLSPGTMRDHGSIQAGVSVSRDGQHVAFVWSASDTPEEAWLITGDGSTRKLTDFGEPFAGELAAGEVVRWHSDDGVEIEGILIRPREGDGPWPLFVEVHGGPSWQWEDMLRMDWHDWAQLLAGHGWAVLLPNPRGSTGYGAAFEKLLYNDVGGGESRDLIAGANAMVERGIADPERLAIGGWSWGGYLTARTITQTGMFKAAVMGAGVANLTSDHGAGDIPAVNTLYYQDHPYDPETWELYARGTPIREASKVTTPTLILHGDADDRVHPTQGQEFFRALQQAGVPTRFVRYPREGHGIHEREHQVDLMQRIIDWLERWVPAGSTPRG